MRYIAAIAVLVLSTSPMRAQDAVPKVLGEPADSPVDAEWVRQHSAGMTVKQSDEYVQPLTSLMTRGKATGYIGETPPRYRYELMTVGGPILLGRDDDRHRFSRALETIKLEGDKLRGGSYLSFEYPLRAANGGFVFIRAEHVISKVGVIIPEVKIPRELEGFDSRHDAVGVHVQQSGIDPFPDLTELMKLPKEKLDGRYVVLLNPLQGPARPGYFNPLKTALPESAHILWFTFGAESELECAYFRPSIHVRMMRESQGARRPK